MMYKKIIKLWKKEQPNKYKLFRLMTKTKKDEKKRYTKDESFDFVNTCSEKEAIEIIDKTRINE